MAKKNAPPAPAAPSPERVKSAIRTGDFATALEVARQLHTLTPTPETLAVRKQALIAALGQAADRDRMVDFNRLMTEADQVDPNDPAWVFERACLLARGGRMGDGLARVDEATRPKIAGHGADRAIRIRTREFLPAELHAGFDLVMAAFRHHEAGNEAGAREAVEPIGLRSPYLEWKVLIRGLIAHAAGDDARAAENFGRLDPTRLPARLAAPVRVAIDPTFKESLPIETANDLLARQQKFTTSPIVDLLRKIAKEFGREKSLVPAFRAADDLLPHLRKVAPQLIPRLGNCLYQAILQQGQPDDMARYRKLLGNPPDDPHFHKLQAQISEAMDEPAVAHNYWQKYGGWLAGKPAGWSEAVLNRARAMVWARMGDNANEAAEAEDEYEDPDEMFGFFGAPPRRRGKPRPVDPPAGECFRQAAQFAPDWPDASRKLFDALVEADKPADAEAAARAFLARHPDDLPLLTALANLVQSQGRAGDAAELWQRILEINPLDRTNRFQVAYAVLADARRTLTQGNAAAAADIIEQQKELVDEQAEASANALRSVIFTKLGKATEAATARGRALAVPGGRLGAAYYMMVDGLLAKLKPADKRVADKLFAEELAKPPTPLEALQLIAAYDRYQVDGVTFRGQKTHAKKVLDPVGRCLTAKAPEIEFERLGHGLCAKEEWKLAKKLADAMLRRFPNNPQFYLIRAEAGLGSNEQAYTQQDRLRRAKQLVEASTEPRHQALLERIDELLKGLSSPFDLMEMFFRGRQE